MLPYYSTQCTYQGSDLFTPPHFGSVVMLSGPRHELQRSVEQPASQAASPTLGCTEEVMVSFLSCGCLFYASITRVQIDVTAIAVFGVAVHPALQETSREIICQAGHYDSMCVRSRTTRFQRNWQHFLWSENMSPCMSTHL